MLSTNIQNAIFSQVNQTFASLHSKISRLLIESNQTFVSLRSKVSRLSIESNQTLYVLRRVNIYQNNVNIVSYIDFDFILILSKC